MPKKHFSDSEEEEFYDVERIVNKRTTPLGVEYEVKWKGFPSSQNTWEPVASLSLAQEAIAAYEEETGKPAGNEVMMVESDEEESLAAASRTHSLPAHSLPAHSLLAHSLPAHSLPAHSPTAHSPPVHSPPVHSLPAHSLPAHSPPAPSPPAYSPPAPHSPPLSPPTTPFKRLRTAGTPLKRVPKHPPRRLAKQYDDDFVVDDDDEEIVQFAQKPRKPAAKDSARDGAEDVTVTSVKEVNGALVWTALLHDGTHSVDLSVEQLKKRAPLALIDYLVSKLRFA